MLCTITWARLKRVPFPTSASDETGQSLVEFALTLPALFLVLTGILIFGVVIFQYVAISQASEVAIRQLIVSRGQTTDPCATVISAASNSAGNIDQSKLTISLNLNGTTYSGSSCTAAVASMVIGANAQVTLTYPAKLLLVGDSISSGFTLTAQEQDKIQ